MLNSFVCIFSQKYALTLAILEYIDLPEKYKTKGNFEFSLTPYRIC